MGGRDVLAWFSEAVCVHVLVYVLFWCTVCGANIRDAVKMYETGNFPMGVWVTTPKRELLYSHLNTDKKTWINGEFNIMRLFPLHPHLAHLQRQQLAEHLMSWKVFHLQLSLHKLIIILRVYLMTKSFFLLLWDLRWNRFWEYLKGNRVLVHCQMKATQHLTNEMQTFLVPRLFSEVWCLKVSFLTRNWYGKTLHLFIWAPHHHSSFPLISLKNSTLAVFQYT